MSQTKAQLIEGSSASELTAAKTLLGAGSAGAPSLTATGDTNTGIFFPTADTIAFAEGGVETVRIDSSGRLLIGTSSASGANLLQVNSDALVNGITIGRGLASISSNTAVGSGALAANTTGTNNVANGYQALYLNTTGAFNTAIGTSTLSNNTTADSNTAVGQGALYSNTGAQNTALGRSTLGNNTTGSNNTAIGNDALILNTTGGSNCCLGYDSGSALTTGSNNTIIGSIAGTAGLADTVIIAAGATERLRIDSSGRLLVGTSTVTTTASSSTNNLLAVESANNYLGVSFTANCNDSNGSYLVLKKSRGTSAGSTTVVQSGDEIGNIFFEATDGSASRSAAAIRAFVDATPGANDMPCRLVFSTTADWASSPTERMRISANGTVTITVGGAEPIVFGGTNATSIFRSGANGSGIHFTTNATAPTDENGALSDNTESFGTGSYRWSVIYAATGSINTSDLTTKQDVENLNLTELNVAIAIKSLIKKYRFKDAVIKKGSDARIHVGVIAQEVEQAFVAEGLDPRHYGMFCEDELEDGSKRLGIRYDELLAFVIAAL